MTIEYACGCGQFKLLEEMFWSEACSKLVCKDSCCSLCEIDSYYCPFMLENMPSQEAMQYQNRSANGFMCPDCEAMLNIIVDGSKHFFICSYCRWDSLDIGLVEDNEQMLIMSSLSKERDSVHERIVNELISYFDARLSPRKQRIPKQQQKKQPPVGSWKWYDMEAKLRVRQLKPEPVNDKTIQDRLNQIQPGGASIQNRNVNTRLYQRFLHPMDQPVRSDALWPSRLLLRTKKSYRCVSAMEKGVPGIVLKPQINPMTGDSSVHRTASWFKKANLAIHYLPSVFVLQKPGMEKNAGSFHLLLINPLDEAVTISFTETKGLQVPTDEFTIGAHEDPNLQETFEQSQASDDKDVERSPFVVSSKQNELVLRFEMDEIQTHVVLCFQLEPLHVPIKIRLEF